MTDERHDIPLPGEFSLADVYGQLPARIAEPYDIESGLARFEQVLGASQTEEGANKPTWRRPHSCESNNCVEVLDDGDVVYVRHTATPEGPVLRFSRAEWNAFGSQVVADAHGVAG
jgi:Domain of unknown function (DUF397)